MKDISKMTLCLIGIPILGTLAQVMFGKEIRFIIASIILLSVGFGWYSRGAKIDDAKGEQDE